MLMILCTTAPRKSKLGAGLDVSGTVVASVDDGLLVIYLEVKLV